MFKSFVKQSLKRLIGDRGGQVAVIFGLAIIPIISIVGFTVDFQMATTQKNKVQQVIDSSVLAGARAAQAGKTKSEIRAVMREYLVAQAASGGANAGLTCGQLQITFAEGSQDIAATVTCAQKTSLMQVIGKDVIDFKVSSTSTWGIGKLDVAFMFDVSGSMNSNNRMTLLKAAAHEALDTLLPEEGGPGTEDVRIAMVSYNSMVNAGDFFEEVTGLTPTRTYYANKTYTEWEVVGTETERERVRVCERVRYCKKYKHGRCKKYKYRNECHYEWQDVEVDVWDEVEHTEEVSKTITSTCVWERPGDKKFTDFAPVNTAPGEPTLPITTSEIYGATTAIYNASQTEGNPQGYLAAAYAKYDANRDRWNTYGTSTCSNTKPVPLTRNRTTLGNYIDSLRAGGGTAGQQGISWSWYMIAEPWQTHFTGDSAPLDYTEPDSVKAVILMTDGEFNREEFDDQGSSDEQARAVCDSIKDNDHVIIYTVAFQAPNSGKAVLDYCASGPEFSFAPENGDELSQAYQAIATSISDLRVKY